MFSLSALKKHINMKQKLRLNIEICPTLNKQYTFFN